jgi:hypothetical protein
MQMNLSILAAGFAVLWTAGLGFSQIQTVGSSSRGAVGPGGRTGDESGSLTSKPVKYEKPTDMEIHQSQALMDALFARAVEEVNPNLHKFETAHFVIFSDTGPKPPKPGVVRPGVDKVIGETMERMYTVLRRRFGIAEDESVWVGKCGIFLLSQNPDRQFHNFATRIDRLDAKVVSSAGGYFHSTAILSYIVMPPQPDVKHSQEAQVEYWKCTLVHEATHAFMSRYVSNKALPTWLNEGIAEATAGTVLDSRILALRMRNANRAGRIGVKAVIETMIMKQVGFREPNVKSVERVLASFSMSEFDYGFAQSWVRFLQLRGREAFIKFVTLCKEGKDDQEAMMEAYGSSRDDLLKAWVKWASNFQ